MNLYLDSMLWIYFFEQNPQFHPATRSLILRAQAARAVFLSSHLVLAEILVVPKRNRDSFTAARYKRFFLLLRHQPDPVYKRNRRAFR